ncbi:hypothetical protein ACFX1Q_032542 [Malus domestica]
MPDLEAEVIARPDLQQRLSTRPKPVARPAEPQLTVEAEATDEQRSTETGLRLPRSSRSFLPRSRHPHCSGKDQFTFFFSTVRTITTAAQPEVQVKLSLQRVDVCAEKRGFCSNPDRDLDPSSFPHGSLVCPVCNSAWKGVIPHGTTIIFFSQPFSAYIATYQDPEVIFKLSLQVVIHATVAFDMAAILASTNH